MKILAIDTSTKYLSVACMEDINPKAVFHEDVGVRHSELLVPVIKDMLEELKWSLKDIKLICVGVGPGSFTGLRVAIATIKGFAAVYGMKVVGVPTLDAIALNYYPGSGLIAPLLDARKGKVYSCIYYRPVGTMLRETEYMLCPISDLLSKINRDITFFGDAVAKYKNELEEHPLARYDERVNWIPKAIEIGRLGLERSFSKTDDPETLDPLYLYAKECNISKAVGEEAEDIN